MGKVLIIESDESTRHLYKTAIEFQQLSVLTADSAKEGLDVIKKEPLDLIILDILTPDLKEINIIEEMKSVITGDMPVIIMTDLKEDTEIIEKSIFGACEFLSKKETTVGDIIKKVRTVIETKE